MHVDSFAIKCIRLVLLAVETVASRSTADLEQEAVNHSHVKPSDFEYLVAGGYRPQFPSLTKYVVSIRTSKPTIYFGDNHFCAGTIVASRMIVTAAHCVVDPNKVITRPRRLNIVAGTPNRLREVRSTLKFSVETVISHANFVRKGGYDIALLRLSRPIPDDNDAIKIIPLVRSQPKPGTVCTIVGWGQLFYGGPYAATAMYGNLTVLQRSVCEKRYPGAFDETMICAVDDKNPVLSACRGDSGSPLVCNNRLAGITAWGARCDRPGVPSVFTNVHYFRNWIRRNNRSRRLRANISAISFLIATLFFHAEYFQQ